MSPETFVLLSGALTFGAPLLLAARELWALRRDDGRRGGGLLERDRAPDVPPPSPAGGVRPLPDCLIPKPLPASAMRTREVEHA
ncbi:hypothetical protein GCM10009416_47920 [Craurococcus roseus]|uniref:Uncharacterized protein n=1 Tax=Craurococcus roseus TaxID=77585 RepID=A0ABP3R8F5_9PROT